MATDAMSELRSTLLKVTPLSFSVSFSLCVTERETSLLSLYQPARHWRQDTHCQCWSDRSPIICVNRQWSQVWCHYVSLHATDDKIPTVTAGLIVLRLFLLIGNGANSDVIISACTPLTTRFSLWLLVFTQGLNFCINLWIIFNFSCATSSCVMLCNFWCLRVPRGRQMT